MRFAAAAIGLALITSAGCGGDSTTSPNRSGAVFARIQPVRRAPGASSTSRLIRAEKVKARRIIATDDLLKPLLDDAGGYAITKMGPIRGGGRHFILGAIVGLRLDRAVEGTYTLPLECSGTTSPPFSLQPTNFSLSQVTALQVVTAFATDDVVA